MFRLPHRCSLGPEDRTYNSSGISPACPKDNDTACEFVYDRSNTGDSVVVEWDLGWVLSL